MQYLTIYIVHTAASPDRVAMNFCQFFEDFQEGPITPFIFLPAL